MRAAFGRSLAVISAVWATLLVTYLVNKASHWDDPEGQAMLLYAAAATLLGMTLSCGFLAVRRKVVGAASHRVRFAVLLATSCLITLVHAALDVPLQLSMGVPLPSSGPMMVWLNFVFYFWIHLAAGGLLMLVDLVEALHAREGELSRMDAEGARAEVSTLRLQVQPHFLYNALNGVSALMLSQRISEADAMLSSLAELLRRSLEADPRACAPLRSELAMAQCYTDVETARFARRLEVAYEVEMDVLDVAVPALVLLPILEKVVSHATASAKPQRVVIGLVRRDGRLNLEVHSTRAEDAPGEDAFAELAGRLRTLHPGHAELTVRTEPAGYLVELALPYAASRLVQARVSSLTASAA